MQLQYQTVSPMLRESLEALMNDNMFDDFVLVGGTALSLQLGHRKSVDIDLFSPATYGTIHWEQIIGYFRAKYRYVYFNNVFPPSLGLSIFAGESTTDCIKIDLYYTEPFVFPVLLIDQIRLASLPELIAMKLDVISRGGRKKDFWDIHALIDRFMIEEMLGFYLKRYPFQEDSMHLRKMLLNFDKADEDWDPLCLTGKHWELIKLDLFEFCSS